MSSGQLDAHYRRFDKMADWLANEAMDRQQSVMEEC